MTILSISTDRRSAFAGGATGLIAGPPGKDGGPGRDGNPGTPGAPGAGVPAGGASGYFLRKQTSADYDTVWFALGIPAGGIVGTTDAQALTHKDLTDLSNTFPTFNQNTTGSAAKWTAARLLAGNSVDGSGNVPFANKFIAQGTADSGLSGAQFLGALGTGLVKNTTSTGVLSIAVAADIASLVGGAAMPLINGTASAGTSNNYAREDHRHPIDTSRAAAGANSDITSLAGLTTPLSIAQGGTGNSGGAWTVTNPTPAGASSSFTSATATIRSQKVGNLVNLEVRINITTNGPAVGWVQVPLPYTPVTGFKCVGREENVSGKPLIGFYSPGASALIVENLTDGSYPGGDGYVLALNGSYEAA